MAEDAAEEAARLMREMAMHVGGGKDDPDMDDDALLLELDDIMKDDGHSGGHGLAAAASRPPASAPAPAPRAPAPAPVPAPAPTTAPAPAPATAVGAAATVAISAAALAALDDGSIGAYDDIAPHPLAGAQLPAPAPVPAAIPARAPAPAPAAPIAAASAATVAAAVPAPARPAPAATVAAARPPAPAPAPARAVAPAAAPMVAPVPALTSEAAAALAALQQRVQLYRQKAVEWKTAGNMEKATSWLRESKELEVDATLLQRGMPYADVLARPAQRQAARERDRAYRELRMAIDDYFKQKVQESSRVAEKARTPGLPMRERDALRAEHAAIVAERGRLDELRTAVDIYAKHPAAPPAPVWHWGTTSDSVALTNDDVSLDEMQVSLLSLVHVKTDKGVLDHGDFHVAYYLPLPTDAPTEQVCTPVKVASRDGTAELTNVHSHAIKRALKAAQRAVERRPAIVELWKTTSGFLGLSRFSAVVARGAFMLDQLLSEAAITLCVPLLAPEKIPDPRAVTRGDAILPASITGRRAAPPGAAGGAGAGAAASGAAAAGSGAKAAAGAGGGGIDDIAIVDGERGALVLRCKLHMPLRDPAVRVVEKRTLIIDYMPPLPASPATGGGSADAGARAGPSPAAGRGLVMSDAAAEAVAAANAMRSGRSPAAGAGHSPSPLMPAPHLPTGEHAPAATSPGVPRGPAAPPGAAPSPARAPGAAAAPRGGGAVAGGGAGTPAAAAGAGASAEVVDKDEDDLPDFLNVKLIESADVLQWEIARMESEIERHRTNPHAPPQFQGEDWDMAPMRLMMLQTKFSVMGDLIAAEKLRLTDYLAKVEAAKAADLALAKRYNRFPTRKAETAYLVQRIRLQKEELEKARTSPEMQAMLKAEAEAAAAAAATGSAGGDAGGAAAAGR